MTGYFAKTAIVSACVAAMALVLSATRFGSAAPSPPFPSITAGSTFVLHPRRIALLIVNADYPDAGVPINGITAETEHLTASLCDRGFDVVVKQNASKAEMDDAVDQLVAKTGPGVEVVIAFAGYGIQVDRENYLLPVDARVWAEGDVGRRGLSVTRLLTRVTSSGAEHVIAVFDASRRNPYERRFRSVSAGLAAIDPPAAAIVMATTAPTRTNGDGADDGQLLRTLVETLNGPDRNIETLFEHAQHGVSLATSGREVPNISSAILDRFTF